MHTLQALVRNFSKTTFLVTLVLLYITTKFRFIWREVQKCREIYGPHGTLHLNCMPAPYYCVHTEERIRTIMWRLILFQLFRGEINFSVANNVVDALAHLYQPFRKGFLNKIRSSSNL